MSNFKKIVLAYSGGLDTSVIIPWLKENYEGCEVIAVAANVGQGDELEGLNEKAIKTGASKLYVADLEEEFVDEYIFPTLKAGAKYEAKYLLGTAFARPVIAKRITQIALEEGADAIAHGCTGKGNDQVRFELAIKAFAPTMPVVAPWRVWELKGREDEIAYAEAHNVPLKISRETNYSKDKNLWHLSHEGLELEDPANEPKYAGNMEMGVTPEEAPDAAEYVGVDFEQGIPVAVNGEKLDGPALIKKLNEIGGRHGVGILDMVENRLIGMKSRGVYETPGGTILYEAHEKLEQALPGQDDAALQAAHGAGVRRSGLQRPVVYAAARGDERLRRSDAKDRDRLRPDEALQGQHHFRRRDQSPFPLRRGDRHLRRGRGVQSGGQRRVHYALWPSHQDSGHEGPEEPIVSPSRPGAKPGRTKTEERVYEALGGQAFRRGGRAAKPAQRIHRI